MISNKIYDVIMVICAGKDCNTEVLAKRVGYEVTVPAPWASYSEIIDGGFYEYAYCPSCQEKR